MKVVMAVEANRTEMEKEAARLIAAGYQIVIFFKAPSAPKEKPRCNMYIDAEIKWTDNKWITRWSKEGMIYYLYLKSKEEMLAFLSEQLGTGTETEEVLE